MITISKKEAMELNKKYNVPFFENGISTDHSGHGHYWLCTSKRNMQLLNKIREEKKVN